MNKKPSHRPASTAHAEEAMMSSPIQDAKKTLDPILRYAPPHVRDQMPKMPPVTPIEWPLRSHREEDRRAFTGDREAFEVQRRLTLDPWILEPPPSFTNSHDIWWIILRTAGVIGVAAFVAWVVVSIPGAGFQHNKRMQASVIDSSISTPMAGTVPILTTPLPQPERPEGPASVVGSASKRDRLAELASSAGVEAPLVDQPPTAIAQEEAHLAQPTAQNLITGQLSGDQVASLLRRGEDFFRARDLVSARLVFRRATEAGDARAAFALASTFDSGVLEKFGFEGFWADVGTARMWYQRAAQFGSAEAPQRLQQLATKINP